MSRGRLMLAVGLFAGLRLCGPAFAADTPADATSGKTILGAASPWRWDAVWSLPVATPATPTTQPMVLHPKIGFFRLQNTFEKPEIPAPPPGWRDAGFDDIGWSRTGLPISDTQFIYTPVLTVRGKFEVTDPAAVKALRLTLAYRGGAVICLNGKEAARVDMPEGEITPATPAKPYPDEAWVDAAGKALPHFELLKDDNKDRAAKRERQGGPIDLPVAALRKGGNVLAIELHRSPIHPSALTWWNGDEWAYGRYRGWNPVGLVDAKLVAEGEGIAANLARPAGIQVWNCMPAATVSAINWGDPAETLRPVVVPASRNGVFSGRLVVSSAEAIKNLKVTVSDLAASGGGKMPAAAVSVRYAEPAVPEKCWTPPGRFDGLLDAIPVEIPVYKPANPKQAGGAVASIWLTVRVPKDAAPGTYEGTVSVAADGLTPTAVPLRVEVSAWTTPDPKDFHAQSFGYLSEDAEAKYYGVPLWGEKHLALMAKAMAVMAQINSRQAQVNLAISFYGGNKGGVDCSNEETLVRWVKQPDGTYKHDFTILDKYLDMVAKAIGKPTLLRVNCWNEVQTKNGALTSGGNFPVTRLDPATGKTDQLEQPLPGTDESYLFWKPVLDEVRKKAEARGWWDVTAFGHNSYCTGPHAAVVSVAKRIWPDGQWAYTAHNGVMGSRFATTQKDQSMPVRYADSLWTMGPLNANRNYRALLKGRPTIWCYTFRTDFRCGTDLAMPRTMLEEEFMRGHDGVSDFGADLYPIKNPNGRGYYCLGNGRGTGGPNDSTQALLAPGPDGAIATERFEMVREGTEIAEAILFIQGAIEDKKITGDLEARANKLLEERMDVLLKEVARRKWAPSDRFERDAKLLALAGEVATAVLRK
ncbi:MAG: DUF6067 family protein [Phycisphaerae bacterium]|nr:DUF6067 family protein [Phycisphaerae bacterium]